MSMPRKGFHHTLRLVAFVLVLAGIALCAATAMGAGWRYETDAQGEAQWYWTSYSSAYAGQDPDRHPTFRGTAFGTTWNYSLTLGWTARPLWLYDGEDKILFRQNLEAGHPQDIIQLTLWTRTHYPDLRLCMNPKVLEVLTRNGVDEILLQNGSDPSEMVATRYVVDNLVQMMEKADLASEEISEVWLGDPQGPVIVPVHGEDQQLSPGADGASEVPGEAA